jgi:hypothetical protein
LVSAIEECRISSLSLADGEGLLLRCKGISSDSFIFAVGGRGFYHVSLNPVGAITPSQVNQMAARD